MGFHLNNSNGISFSEINLGKYQRQATKSLEKLSSGQQINKAVDNPSGLTASERLRAQLSGVKQAIKNAESSISVLQIGDSSLQEISNILLTMRENALAASNTIFNDPASEQVNRIEFKELKNTLDSIARGTKFGSEPLLSGGSYGLSGIATGNHLSFVSGSEETKSSPLEGYSVVIDSPATAAYLGGSLEVEEALETVADDYDLPPVSVTVVQDGQTINYTSKIDENADQFVSGLQKELDRNGMQMNAVLQDDKLALTSRQLGSKHTFSASSSVAGLLSTEAMKFQAANLGDDIVGAINGEVALGDGTLLRGRSDNPKTADLVVSYTGNQTDIDNLDSESVGFVHIQNNSMRFQIGANGNNVVRLAIPTINSDHIGVGVVNDSQFKSLQDTTLDSQSQARDTVNIIDQAMSQVSVVRGKLGSMQKNTLERNLAVLRVTQENIASAESTIRDADMASEMSKLIQADIHMEGAAKSINFSQAQSSKTMRLLLNNLRS